MMIIMNGILSMGMQFWKKILIAINKHNLLSVLLVDKHKIIITRKKWWNQYLKESV